MIGLNPKKVAKLQKEVTDLITTVENLKNEATNAYKKSEQAIILYKQLGIDTNTEWWDEPMHTFDNPADMILANEIKKNAMKDYISKNPSLKKRFVFHGGCLGCKTPIKEGCGVCLGCNYANWEKDKPRLFSN